MVKKAGILMNVPHHPSSRPAAQSAESASAARPPFAVRSFGLSDRGQVRHTNEDRFVVAELTRTLRVRHSNLPQNKAALSRHRGHVFLVADGVGGKRAGEVASGLSVLSVEEFLLNTLKRFRNVQAGEELGVLRDLQSALFQADARIFQEALAHPEWQGMATTLTMAIAVNWRLFVAHAGDSRCYLYSGKKLQQLTHDHTLTAEMVRRGIIAPQDEDGHPGRHLVTNILGGKEPGVQAELHSLDLHADDVLLVCSDGLTEMISDDRIAAILDAEDQPQGACERLVAEANQRGGKDNITAIVAHIQGGGS